MRESQDMPASVQSKGDQWGRKEVRSFRWNIPICDYIKGVIHVS